MKHTLLFFVLLPLGALAQIPDGYYSSVKDGQTSDAIYSALHSRISSHAVLSYDDLEDYYEPIDFDENGHLMDIYSTCTLTMADANKQQSGVCDAWNKEHTIPQSWFSGGGIKSDLFHVYPTDACVNGTRSNYPYGENAETTLGLKSGKDPNNHGLGSMGTNTFGGYSVGKVYEPDDRFKGDIARNYFYMVTCYAYSNFTSSDGAKMFTSTGFTEFALKLLLKWHRQDPVSQKEIDRNNGVYKVQKNRNPFIDYPYLVEYIWGEKKGQKLDLSQIISSEDPSFIPGQSSGLLESTDPLLCSNDTNLLFPTLIEGQSSTLTSTLQAYRMTHAITCTLTGADASQFRVSPSSIDQSKATGTHVLSITYTPTTKALHSAQLLVSSDSANTITIHLSGACATTCQVNWLVGGETYTTGSPTTEVALGGRIQQLPDAPKSISELSEQFVGWSQYPIPDSTNHVPQDLFSSLKDAPAIQSDVTFHAVFAHVSQQGGGEEKIVFEAGKSTTGWTNTKMKSSNGYLIMISNSSLVSPEIDLSLLESVTIHMRTYGGTSYNTITISAGGSTLGSVSASNSTMNDQTWKNTSSLSGKSAITFSSSINASDKGPALDKVTIQMQGVKYVYSRFITTNPSQPAAVLETDDHSKSQIPTSKFLRNGRLYMLVNDKVYDVNGHVVQKAAFCD